MENYGEILGLIEEVRDILDLHEAKKGEKPTAKQRAALGAKFSKMLAPEKKKKKKKGYQAGEHEKDWHDKVKKGHRSKTVHNPFKRLKTAVHKSGPKKGKPKHGLGKGPRGSTSVPGSPKGVWKCRCKNYKCLCKNKVEKYHKKVVIDRAYKAKYNIDYRKWRKQHAGKYKAGKGKWKATKDVTRKTH